MLREPFPSWPVAFAILVTLAAFGVILNGYGSFVVQRVEQVYSDFRTSLLSDRIVGDHPDIVIVSVGDGATASSLTIGGQRSEIDRQQLARLIEQLDDASPRAIGFDVPIRGAGDPAKDQALQRALRESKTRIVLGVRSDRTEPMSERRLWSEKFLAGTGRQIGHISVIAEGDRVVGFDSPALAMGNPPDAFATLMARALRPAVRTSFGPIAWLQRVDDTGPLSRLLNLGGQQPFAVHYSSNLLDLTKPQPRGNPFANKLVIVTSGLGEDYRLRTPLTAWSNEALSPIQIQAQAIAQLVDTRTAANLPARNSRVLLFVIACLGGLIGWYRSRGWNIGALAVSLLFLFVLDCVFFAWFNIHLPLVEGVVCWVLAEIAGRQFRRWLQWEERHGQTWPLPGMDGYVEVRPPRDMGEVVRSKVRDLSSQMRRRDN